MKYLTKKNKILFFIGLVFLFIISSSLTYAYFNTRVSGNENATDQVVSAGTLEIEFSDGPEINFLNILPGDWIAKNIVLENTGSLDAYYDIGWSTLSNGIINNELYVTWTCKLLDRTTEEEIGYCDNPGDSRPVGTTTNDLIASHLLVPEGTTSIIELKFLFIDTGENQNYNQNKTFSGIIQIQDTLGELVNLQGIVYDQNDNPLVNSIVELHSSPRTAVTDNKGKYYFNGVETGEHTLTVKDQNNQVIATDNITVSLDENPEVISKSIKWNNKLTSSYLAVDIGTNTIDDYRIEDEATSKFCFVVDDNGYIRSYLNNQKGIVSNKPCPRDVVIPIETDYYYTDSGQATLEDIFTTLRTHTENIDITRINTFNYYYGNEETYPTQNAAYLPITSVRIHDGIVRLGEGSFINNRLTSIVIPDSVEKIYERAFKNNRLESVVLPNNPSFVKLYESAFENNNLTSISIPSTVTYISSSVFNNNKLTSITIPNSVTHIGNSAFENNLITSATLPNNDSYDTIYGSLLKDNKLNSITIPSSITKIYDYAFAGNKLTSVAIPTNSSFVKLYEGVFENNELTSVTIPSNITYISDNVFKGNKLGSITIPNSVTHIGNSAFENNLITSATLPNNDSYDTIYGSLLKDNKLNSITIPAEISAIGISAFENNELTSISLPSSLTEISEYAFKNNKLTSVNFASTSDSSLDLLKGSFANNNITSLNIPSYVTYISAGTFNNNLLTGNDAYIFLRSDENNDNIAEIDSSWLISYGGANKENVTIPSSVRVIKDDAMSYCNLKSVIIPSTVTEIRDDSFEGNELESVIIKTKTSSSDFSSYYPNWGWSDNIECVTNNLSNVTNGCITWGAN